MTSVAPRGAAVGGLVLAAGAARRFGSAKQLAIFDGRPMLEHALAAMAAAALDAVAVVLGAHADAVLAAVDLHGAQAVICDDWATGQAASLRAGVEALADRVEAIVVTLGDQPLIDHRAIGRVVGARGGESVAIRASYAGRPGHPVLFEHELFPALTELRGDRGARDLLGGAAVRLVACDGLGSDADLDTASHPGLSGV